MICNFHLYKHIELHRLQKYGQREDMALPTHTRT